MSFTANRVATLRERLVRLEFRVRGHVSFINSERGTPGCVMRSDILRIELLARFGGVYLDRNVKPIRPLDKMCPPEVVAWAACEQLDIVTTAAMGFPPNHPAVWHTVAMIEESCFERRYVGDQAGQG